MPLRSLLTCLLGLLGAAVAADALAGPVRVLTFIETTSDGADRCKASLKEYAAAHRQHGTQALVLQELARPEKFVLLESAESTEDPRAPGATLEEALGTLLAAPPDRRNNREFGDASGAAAADAGTSASVYVVAHLDMAPPERAKGEAALLRIREAARKSAGNLRFDVWQQTDRPNHFNLIAVWTRRAKFNEFAASPAAREFRKSVASSLGSPYDERLYDRVD